MLFVVCSHIQREMPTQLNTYGKPTKVKLTIDAPDPLVVTSWGTSRSGHYH